MERLARRVGAVSYLNTKPLIHFLPDLAPELDLQLAVPRQLALKLAQGELDVALIPSVEYFRAEASYTILPGLSISSYGPVMSVKLCSRVPFTAIGSVALDDGSRTSIALMQILLHHLFDCAPHPVPLPLSQDPRTAWTDAVLVIGDRAMRIADGEFPYTLDLGYEWSRWTGLPFVFAFWAVGEGVAVPESMHTAFITAATRGRQAIASFVPAEAKRLGLDEIQCRYYLEHIIRHRFGPAEWSGLRKFYELATGLGLTPEGVNCVFHGTCDFAASC